MKFIFLFIIFLILINIINSLKEAKDFLIEFIKVVSKDKVTIELSEQCLGNFFDYQFLLLKKNFKENNFQNLSKNLENIIIDIILNCPNYELITLFNETELDNFGSLPDIYNPSFYFKLYNLGSTVYSQYNNNSLTGTSLGLISGKFINLFKNSSLNELDYSNNNSSLNELDNSNNNFTENYSILNKFEDYFEIIGGIFIGMKEKDDGNESKCYNDIIQGKDEIIKNIQKSWEKVDKNKAFGSIIKEILFKLITVKGLFADCNILGLGSSIISKLNRKEIGNLMGKIIGNSNLYLSYIGQILDNFKNNNMREAGKYGGKIISDIFDFHVK